MPQPSRAIGILALLGGVFCWGVTPIFLRALTPYLDGWTANGIRYPLSAVLYWPLLVASLRSGRLDMAFFKRCLVPALLAMAGQVFWSLSHYELQASEIGFLVRLSMVWAIVGSMVLFRDERKLLWRGGFYAGLALIVVGFMVMTWSGRSGSATQEPEGDFTLGVVWILLCGVSFGLYMVSVRRWLGSADPLLAFGVVAQLVSIGLVAGMFAAGDWRLIGQQTVKSWTLLGCSSVLGIALGHILMYTAVQRLGAAIASCCQTLMPFVTAAAASLSLGEQLVAQQWVGGVVIVVGAMILLSLKQVVEQPQDGRAVPADVAD